MVRTDISAGQKSITFKESHKALAGNVVPNVYRNSNNAPSAQLKGTLMRNEGGQLTIADGFAVAFKNSYSNDVDLKDAQKRINSDENVGISNSGKILSIETRKMPHNNDVLNLYTADYEATEYTFKLNVSGLDNVTAYLQDTYTATEVELTEGQDVEYSFNVNAADAASTATNRFNIVFTTSALKSDKFGISDFKVYPNPVSDNKFTIETPFEGDTTVVLFNQLGQQINCKTSVAGNAVNVEPQIELAAGIYMVQVEGAGTKISKKLLIQ